MAAEIASKDDYKELEEQQSAEKADLKAQDMQDELSEIYAVNVQVNLDFTAKLIIGSIGMLFLFTFALLIFSYFPLGREFFKNFIIKII